MPQIPFPTAALVRCRKGAAAVEFALLLPILALLLIGLWTAASALLDQMDADAAAGASARFSFATGALPGGQVGGAGSLRGGPLGEVVMLVDCAINPGAFAGCQSDPKGRYVRIRVTLPGGRASAATIRLG
jgi:Flp pilus assembly pilin Flp